MIRNYEIGKFSIETPNTWVIFVEKIFDMEVKHETFVIPNDLDTVFIF